MAMRNERPTETISKARGGFIKREVYRDGSTYYCVSQRRNSRLWMGCFSSRKDAARALANI